jgi:hypothetical protein
MTRAALAVGAVAVAAGLTSAAVAEQSRPINPAGTYAVSTASDTGQPMTGTLVITATPDGYAGSFTSPGLPAPVPVASVTTNGKQMMATLNNGSGFVLVWVEMASDGSFKGTWHELSAGIAATGKKQK